MTIKFMTKNRLFIKNNESLKNSWRIKFRVNLNLHYHSLYINDAKLKCYTVFPYLYAFIHIRGKSGHHPGGGGTKTVY